MGICCVKEKIDIITEINTIEGLMKVFNDDKTILEQRRNIFLKFKDKNSQYTAKEKEFAWKYKELTSIELYKILDVYQYNLEGLETLVKELKKVEMFFDEKSVKKLIPNLLKIRSSYEWIQDEDKKIVKFYSDTFYQINEILSTISKRK